MSDSFKYWWEKINIDFFILKVEKYAGWRYGQTLMNELCAAKPELYASLPAECDVFYTNDHLWDKFLPYVAANWDNK